MAAVGARGASWATSHLLLLALLLVASSSSGARPVAASRLGGQEAHLPKAVSISYPPFTSALNCSYDGSVDAPATAICTPSDPPGQIVFSYDNDVASVRYAYDKKVQLYKKGSQYAASFSSEFVINFDRDSERSVKRVFGGGWAFAITPDQKVGSSGSESLGLFDIDTVTGKSLRGDKTKTVAVEIDTSRAYDWDPAVPHVGLDINSVDSVVDQFLWDGASFIDRNIAVFIDYDAKKEYLAVRFQNLTADGKPDKKHAKLYLQYSPFKLSDHVNDKSYVGFSSRVPVTDDGTYRLFDWKFSTKWVRTNNWH